MTLGYRGDRDDVDRIARSDIALASDSPPGASTISSSSSREVPDALVCERMFREPRMERRPSSASRRTAQYRGATPDGCRSAGGSSRPSRRPQPSRGHRRASPVVRAGVAIAQDRPTFGERLDRLRLVTPSRISSRSENGPPSAMRLLGVSVESRLVLSRVRRRQQPVPAVSISRTRPPPPRPTSAAIISWKSGRSRGTSVSRSRRRGPSDPERSARRTSSLPSRSDRSPRQHARMAGASIRSGVDLAGPRRSATARSRGWRSLREETSRRGHDRRVGPPWRDPAARAGAGATCAPSVELPSPNARATTLAPRDCVTAARTRRPEGGKPAADGRFFRSRSSRRGPARVTLPGHAEHDEHQDSSSRRRTPWRSPSRTLASLGTPAIVDTNPSGCGTRRGIDRARAELPEPATRGRADDQLGCAATTAGCRRGVIPRSRIQAASRPRSRRRDSRRRSTRGRAAVVPTSPEGHHERTLLGRSSYDQSGPAAANRVPPRQAQSPSCGGSA